jgi:hypothetical protein
MAQHGAPPHRSTGPVEGHTGDVSRVGLIPAAGMARRMGISTPKELLEVDDRPVIEYSVDHMVSAGLRRIVVVIRHGKEAISDHLDATYPDIEFEYVFQTGSIGNLLDAIRVAVPAVAGCQVYFLMPDTIITPNPFSAPTSGEVTLLCFAAGGGEWRNFGVVSEKFGRLIDKPNEYVGSTCWGALVWGPAFTERLATHDNLTEAINQADWSHVVVIDDYRDIGLGPQIESPERGAVAP